MILVFGGAYNGKLEYAKAKYNIKDEEIFFCNEKELNYSKKIICGLHKFIYELGKYGENPLDILKENIKELEDKIIICDEISSGIVPLEKSNRIWREDTGRCLQYLTKNSCTVVRIFCGLEMVLKDV
ncbi:bifunctional adenosylcobinamide kinase/adenosylcobinamide-phosphate guanylyltransferase [Clostridium gasigenes]|uniref:Cobinamide kinase / cobinamide phosphate guanyltransferase n=1 Tax=Clostridium gasigenes TaxID=94869 RepID=A0A1H0NLW1_9CLOT|nr:bifunctional adenosylcobinamide kinase/adenosylcobinamide-phosphate guanylyltransferase [Clostridium gasigenes]MBB6623658.1 bifunctional adenosylcobinamide kinase/adenosylcobinamide-phosphate guanylyltransferase [Clostridium gasigenes]MBU3087541.1 bifunctional adenosylcobinamide kinase/adenosylcobinamide-phosphate guanylyltransferase [Clostridium gasigenes]SDO93330.1 Cobinamide kinase / cobinamide phosphate guanyltransferase [Clostridium gasigenes]